MTTLKTNFVHVAADTCINAIHLGFLRESKQSKHCQCKAIIALLWLLWHICCVMTGILLFCFQLGEIAYHDFRGIFSNEEEKESIVKDLGEESKVLLCQWVELSLPSHVMCKSSIDSFKSPFWSYLYSN